MDNKIIVTDEMLRHCMPVTEELLYEIDMERNKSIPNHIFSLKHENNIRKIIKKYNRSPRQQFARKTAAVLLAAIVLLNALLIACIPTYRKRVFDIVTTVYEEFTSIFTQDDESLEDFDFNFIEPSYIPNGFNVEEKFETHYSLQIDYANNHLQYIFYQQKVITSGERILDTENAETSTIERNNIEITYFYNKGIYNVYWQDDKYLFSIKAEIEFDELLKMIEGIQK